MEPAQDQESNLLHPDRIPLRHGSSVRSKTSYRQVPSVGDDAENDDFRSSLIQRLSPMLPEISRLSRSLTVGLGIRDPEGPLLQSDSVNDSFASGHGHSRSTSDQFRDLADSTRESTELQKHPDPRLSDPVDTESHHMDSPSIIIHPGEETNGNMNCPSRRNIVQRRTSWLSLSILFLAFYSTAFSGIYLVVAFVKPRFGRRIGNDGGIPPSTASLLTAFFAKTIELSFVTVFVAFLGQVLTRRSLTTKSSGLTIADMSMRGWIMQPGTLITHWENVKYSGLTYLGMISLTAALMGMLYTTAAESLVSPKLRFGLPEDKVLWGQVATKFANPDYLAEQCQTPISLDMDPKSRNSTCLQMYHVGQAYHNYQQYIERWGSQVQKGVEMPTDLSYRPPPIGNWYDNTTVTGSWIEVQNMSEASSKHGRLINNVTAALPHAGVYASSRDPANALRQPQDFDGRGQFNISASVPSPIVNVLCAGMTEEELEPILYTTWPNPEQEKYNASWYADPPDDIAGPPGSWINKTAVDDIFNFGPDGGQQAPVFPTTPSYYNTIVNVTGAWPANAIYVLGATSRSTSDPPYVLCALKGGLTSKCSTHYHATASGGMLNTDCDDDNPMAYSHTAPDMPPAIYDPDWKNVASEWVLSVNLGDGITNSQSSNARLLTQFVPSFDNETLTASLSPHLPSIAEALATMAGSTLLLSTEDAPFNHTWPYEGTAVAPGGKPIYQDYNAKIRVSDYASGSTEEWHKLFFIVLVLVFLTNLVCLVYMYLEIRGVQLTDFTEPQNAFALALNSPPSAKVNGACGGGPEGPQLKEKWVISMDEHDEHYFISSRAEREELVREKMIRNRRLSPQSNPPLSPAVSEYRRVSQTKSSLGLLR